ncbi:MAG: hypothetical protein RLZZ282_313 [Verrucomicrobiota bacterium]|jgi:hypothetical protein
MRFSIVQFNLNKVSDSLGGMRVEDDFLGTDSFDTGRISAYWRPSWEAAIDPCLGVDF